MKRRVFWNISLLAEKYKKNFDPIKMKMDERLNNIKSDNNG